MRISFLLAVLLFGAEQASAQRTITAEEARATAHQIEAATNHGNPEVLNRFIYVDSLLGRVRAKSHMMQDPEFFAGFSSAFTQKFVQYGNQIVAAVKQGNYRLLRQYESNGTQHLLFRMFGSGGLNYHDYSLVRIGDSIKAADVYIYTVDEFLSHNMANLADMMGYSMEGLPADSSVLLKLTDEFKKKNYAQVKADYDKLDEKYKRNKDIELIYINSCHFIEPSLYETALEQFGSQYPDAPSGYLMMMDFYYLRKEYDKGLVAVDKMDKLLGTDPALDILRGNFYLLAGKQPESLACFERVYHYDPTIATNNRMLILAYESSGDKPKAKQVMTEFRKTNVYHEDDFADLLTKYPDLK